MIQPGYISKNNAGTHIVNAIKVVAEGGTYFSDDIKEDLFKVLTGAEVEDGQYPEGFFIPKDLTDRELEVLKLIANEYSTAEIAEQMQIDTDVRGRSHLPSQIRVSK